MIDFNIKILERKLSNTPSFEPFEYSDEYDNISTIFNYLCDQIQEHELAIFELGILDKKWVSDIRFDFSSIIEYIPDLIIFLKYKKEEKFKLNFCELLVIWHFEKNGSTVKITCLEKKEKLETSIDINKYFL